MRSIQNIGIDRRNLFKGAAALSASAAAHSDGKRTRSRARQPDHCLGHCLFHRRRRCAARPTDAELGAANGFEVEYVALPGSDYSTRLATAVQAGDVPDVIMMSTDTLFYADRGGWSMLRMSMTP